MDRECNKCVYSTRDGDCRKWNCEGTVTVEDIKAEAKADAIDECKTILKSHHMYRTCEDDYNAKIEAPFYKGLWKSFEQLKEM